MYNNYKQALHIINKFTPTIEELKQQLDLVDVHFEQWNIEELQYLEALAAELEYDPEKIAYVEKVPHVPKYFVSDIFIKLHMVALCLFNFFHIH